MGPKEFSESLENGAADFLRRAKSELEAVDQKVHDIRKRGGNGPELQAQFMAARRKKAQILKDLPYRLQEEIGSIDDKDKQRLLAISTNLADIAHESVIKAGHHEIFEEELEIVLRNVSGRMLDIYIQSFERS